MENTQSLKIGDLIETPPVQTVIRLDEAFRNSRAVIESFVLTSEVADHFAVLSNILAHNTGKGCFIQGDFGSGKSHFLAALGAWLGEYDGIERLTRAHDGLMQLKKSGRRFLPVNVSLVNYRSSTPLERILASAVEEKFAERNVHVSLSPLAVFLQRFKEILQEPALADSFDSFRGGDKKEIDTWYAADKRKAYTLCVRFLKNQGLTIPEILVEERHEIFSRIMETIRNEGFDGMVLLIDELSEFFRSKSNSTLLNEDARTLQFLGELSSSEPLWIIAAVQESIERTGDIAPATFRKIKDRFPVKFYLSTMHIRDLISKRLVKHKPGANEHIYRIYQDYKKHFPRFPYGFEVFCAVYPVHPVTISLLEGLGELFSQHRGIVDFVHTRLAGDPERRIENILGHSCYELLAPDSIYEHFTSKLSEFSSYHIYPRHIVPHLDEVTDRIIEELDDRALARRLIRVLVLYAMHPTARKPDVRTLAELSACMLSTHDPDVNAQFIQDVLLEPIVEQSRFLIKESVPDDPLQTIYSIVTQEDHTKTLSAKVKRAFNEISVHDSRLVIEPLALLQVTTSWPGPDILNEPIERNVTWRLSSRRVIVAFIQKDTAQTLSDRICIMLDSGKADFAVAIVFGQEEFSCKHTAVWRIPFPKENCDIQREYLAHRMIAGELHHSNPADTPLIPLISERIDRLGRAVQQETLNCIYSGSFDNKGIHIDPAALQMKRFDRLLEAVGEFILEERYPKFKQIASKLLSPTPRLYHIIFDEFVAPGSISMANARNRGINQAIDSIAAPLGLIEVKSGSYLLSPNPGDNTFLSYFFDLLHSSDTTPIEEVLHNMRTGPYGVLPDAAEFLIGTLAHCGLITLLNRGRTVPLDFLKLDSVANADAIAPGELISQSCRELLMTECSFLAPSGGFGSFGLRQQRETWQAVIKLNKSLENVLNNLNGKIASSAGYSAFDSFDMDAVREKIKRIATLLSEIKVSYSAREGLERFLNAWCSLELTEDDIDFIKKLNRFFHHNAEHFIFISHYLRNRSVENAVNSNSEIARCHETVSLLLHEPEKMVVSDEGEMLETTFNLFRQTYAEYYYTRHELYYKADDKPQLSKYAARILGILRNLASIRFLDRPPGLEPLLREIEQPARQVCRRSIHEELLRSPVCGCNFKIGDTSETHTIDNPEEIIEESLKKYLQILRAPAVLEPLTARAYALKDINTAVSAKLNRMSELVQKSGKDRVKALLDLLDEQIIAELERALSGNTVIEDRPLETLTAKLSGRRLTPENVRRIVDEWIDNADKDTILSIESNTPHLPEKADRRASWWLLLRSDTFPDKLREIPQTELDTMERSIETLFPTEELEKNLSELDNERLVKFITGETIHTRAIRAAWLILAGRVLDRSVEKDIIGTNSRHVNPSVAASCTHRMKQLYRLTELMTASLPERLCARIYCASLIHDSWATRELQNAAEILIRDIAEAGNDWLDTLPVVEPIELHKGPVVLIVDALPPDVWMEAAASLESIIANSTRAWFQLENAPQTVPSLNTLFNFSEDSDPFDEFTARNIPYHQVEGNESRPLIDIIPPFDQVTATVIRLGIIDRAVHHGSMRLCDLPELLRNILSDNLLQLITLCTQQKRRLILTTDHGLTLSNKRLSHGKGGVYEKAVFRVEWKA